MDVLIWTGVAISVAGIAALIWCGVYAMRARRQARSDDELRARLQRAVLVNLAALGASVLGLMLVVLGIFLG